MSESAAGRTRIELEANRREAEPTRELEMEGARIQFEKAAKNTDAEVEGDESIPKPSILKPSHPDEFVISTPTNEFEDTPMTPDGREASRSGDKEMGESFDLMDRDQSPDDVRYTPGAEASSSEPPSIRCRNR